MLLLLNLSVIFGIIFAIIRLENKVFLFDVYISDLLKSFAMYSRIKGHLPQGPSIPWEELGISSSFFSENFQHPKTQYAPAMKLLDPELTPIDLKLVETNYQGPIKENREELASTPLRPNDLENKKFDDMKRNSIAYMPANSIAFEIITTNGFFSINIETLAQMANYPLCLATLDENIIGMPIYLKEHSAWHQYFNGYY